MSVCTFTRHHAPLGLAIPTTLIPNSLLCFWLSTFSMGNDFTPFHSLPMCPIVDTQVSLCKTIPGMTSCGLHGAKAFYHVFCAEMSPCIWQWPPWRPAAASYSCLKHKECLLTWWTLRGTSEFFFNGTNDYFLKGPLQRISQGETLCSSFLSVPQDLAKLATHLDPLKQFTTYLYISLRLRFPKYKVHVLT